MIDIDNIKKIRSKYGEDISHQVIVHISEIFTSLTHYKNIVARFDEEVFCIVLKDVTQSSAKDIFQKILEEVKSTAIYTNDKQEIRFTISMGMVIGNEEDLEESISQADMLLYKAKQEGFHLILSS